MVDSLMLMLMVMLMMDRCHRYFGLLLMMNMRRRASTDWRMFPISNFHRPKFHTTTTTTVTMMGMMTMTIAMNILGCCRCCDAHVMCGCHDDDDDDDDEHDDDEFLFVSRDESLPV